MNQTHSTRFLYPMLAVSLLLGSVIYLLNGCRSEQINSVWAVDTIRVDGQSSDWDNVPRIVLDKQASFSACNDDHTLYLFFHATDSALARNIERRGLNVWFDTEGKKKKYFGISYRVPRSQMDRNELMPPEDDPMMKRDDLPRKDFVPPALEGLAVLNGSARDRIPISDKENGAPTAGFKNEGGGITYEFAIQLSSNEAKYAIGTKPGSVLSLGIEYGGTDPDHSHSRKGGRGKGPDRDSNPGGGEGGFGGGPPPGGGMGGDGEMPQGGGGRGGHGMHGGRRGGAEHRSIEHTEIWLNLVLAASKPAPSK